MNYEITTYLAFALFLVSEAMGLIQKSKANGILHSIICVLSGSECAARTLKEMAETKMEEGESTL